MSDAYRATYRLQFRGDFDFAAAERIVPYLARLGISHVYASPVFKAAPGSTHGYDVVDPNVIEPELGGEAGLRALIAALHAHGMGLILDIVPNHMGVSPANPYWWDVLVHGQKSRFARWFDINWHQPGAPGKVVCPVLGAPYGEILANGELQVARDAEGTPQLRYYDNVYPLTPASFDMWTDDTIRAVNQDRDKLHHVLEAQHYRLAHWRAVVDWLNYRRFFDINELIGVRVEDERVFEESHRLTLDLVAEGLIDGLRLDHIDGLSDPKGYLERLRARVGALAGGRPCLILVEKILGEGEPIRADWPIDGTTGYEFLNEVNRLLVDPAGDEPLAEFYRSFTGDPLGFEQHARVAKSELLRGTFAGELERLVNMALDLADADRATRDLGRIRLRRALQALIAAYPIYRTYVDAAGTGETDKGWLARIRATAANDPTQEDTTALDFLVAVLTEPHDAARVTFAARLQQLTGPIMAKSLEDTAFYRYYRLAALNEVGGEPDRFEIAVRGLHAAARERQERYPLNLLTTATHDTKRGEDVRARLLGLAEVAPSWIEAVEHWHGLTAPLREEDGLPDAKSAYLYYQTLVGVWPPGLQIDDTEGLQALGDRLIQYLQKALREAKEATRWTAPDLDFEASVSNFVRATLDPARSRPFLADIAEFRRALDPIGVVNGLSQVLLKLTAPGLPDIYQGCETWSFTLVDPDNRRPVDFPALDDMLQAGGAPQELLDHWPDGRIKQAITARTLAVRRRHPAWFTTGEYRIFAIEGEAQRHALSYFRGESAAGQGAITVIARAPAALLGGREEPRFGTAVWRDTTLSVPPDLPAEGWVEAFTGKRFTVEDGKLALSDLLSDVPVALLVRE